MLKIMLLVGSMAIVAIANAATPSDSVKATIENLFKAMRTSDAVLLKKCFAENAVFQTISTNKLTGEATVVNVAVNDFVAQIQKLPKDSADERIVFDMIKVDAALANVWTPYKFYYNGIFSHCGVNSFTLVRTAGEWKIQYLIDTRRKTACE